MKRTVIGEIRRCDNGTGIYMPFKLKFHLLRNVYSVMSALAKEMLHAEKKLPLTGGLCLEYHSGLSQVRQGCFYCYGGKKDVKIEDMWFCWTCAPDIIRDMEIQAKAPPLPNEDT